MSDYHGTDEQFSSLDDVKKKITTSLEPGDSSRTLPLKTSPPEGFLFRRRTRITRPFPVEFHRASELGKTTPPRTEINEDEDEDANEDMEEDKKDLYQLHPSDKGDKGFTTVGFIFKGEIFVASDHVSKSDVENIIELNSHMIATLSGGSEVLLKVLQHKCRQHERKNGRRISVAETSKWMAEFLSSGTKEWSSVEMLIGGLDEGGDPALYHVDGRGKFENCESKLYFTGEKPAFTRFATGSGYNGALGVIHFWLRHAMSSDEAVVVAKAAICFGVRKTLVAGSFVSVYQLGPTGLRKRIEGDYVRAWLKMNVHGNLLT